MTFHSNNEARMDIVDFTEKMFGIKLLDYQKEYIKYVDKYPNYQIVMSRGRTTPSWIMSDLITKCALRMDKKDEVCK